MKILHSLFTFVLFNAASCSNLMSEDPAGVAGPASDEPVRVLFSPKGGCTEAVVDLIGKARKTVRVQAYSFTSPSVIDALVKAKKRGVDVLVILDRSDFGTDEQKALTGSGVPVLIDKKHPIAHAKVTIVDGVEVESGSFNYTRQAEHNSENCNFIRLPGVVRRYEANWEEHRTHAIPVADYR